MKHGIRIAVFALFTTLVLGCTRSTEPDGLDPIGPLVYQPKVGVRDAEKLIELGVEITGRLGSLDIDFLKHPPPYGCGGCVPQVKPSRVKVPKTPPPPPTEAQFENGIEVLRAAFKAQQLGERIRLQPTEQ